MGFWKRLFGPKSERPITVPAPVTATVEEAEEFTSVRDRIEDMHISLGQMTEQYGKELRELQTVRSLVADRNAELALMQGRLSTKKLHGIIAAQTETNRFLTDALQAALKKTEDESIKRLVANHYRIRTGGY